MGKRIAATALRSRNDGRVAFCELPARRHPEYRGSSTTVQPPGISPPAKIRRPEPGERASRGGATRNFGAPPMSLQAPGISPSAKIRSPCVWGASSPTAGRRMRTGTPQAALAGSRLMLGVTLPKAQPRPFGRGCAFGGATRNRTGDKGFADLCLTSWLWRHISGD